MSAQNSQYLASKVLTAPPQRLHLMLIEGAIRFGRQAESSLHVNDTVAAAPPLLRAIDIMGELVANVRQQKDELNQRLTDLYWFMFRRFTEAKIYSDAGKLAEALKLLEYERETWLLLCEQTAQSPTMPSTPPAAAPQRQASAYSTSQRAATNKAAGFSFEA